MLLPVCRELLEERMGHGMGAAPPEHPLQKVHVPGLPCALGFLLQKKHTLFLYNIYMCVYIFSTIWSLLQSGLRGFTLSKFRWT